MISRIRDAVSLGVLPTLTPAASSASWRPRSPMSRTRLRQRVPWSCLQVQ